MVSTRPVRIQMFSEQKCKCWFCGRFCWLDRGTKVKRHDTQFTVEHIYPKVLGGQNTYYNVVGACHKCNCKRGMDYQVAVSTTEKQVYMEHKHLLRQIQQSIDQKKQVAVRNVQKTIAASKLKERDQINTTRNRRLQKVKEKQNVFISY